MKLRAFIFESNSILTKIKGISEFQNFPLERRAEIIYNLCKQSLEMLGEGSNRTVFDLGNGKAIKVSYSESVTYDIESSISQTKAESQMCKIAQKAQLIPEIYEVGKEYLYLIIEKVENLDEGSKEKISSYFKFNTFEEFTRALKIMSGNEKVSKEEIEEIKTHRDFLVAITVMKDCGYAISDMVNPNNWGLDPQGRPVMIDTGLTTENKGSIMSRQKDKIEAYNKKTPLQDPTQKVQGNQKSIENSNPKNSSEEATQKIRIA
jgi:hypothetical protein